MFHKHYNVYETVEAATSLSQERNKTIRSDVLVHNAQITDEISKINDQYRLYD